MSRLEWAFVALFSAVMSISFELTDADFSASSARIMATVAAVFALRPTRRRGKARGGKAS